MFTPFVIFGRFRAGAIFSRGATLTNRTGPVGPNRHTFPTAAMCRTEAAGVGRRIYYQWPKAAMRRQGRRETPACEVYPNRRRAFWGTLDRSIVRSRASPRSGRSKGPRTLRVRGGARARVSPAALAMPGTYSVCVAAPYALFFASLRFI